MDTFPKMVNVPEAVPDVVPDVLKFPSMITVEEGSVLVPLPLNVRLWYPGSVPFGRMTV